MTTIANWSLSNCTALEEIKLPNTITDIGNSSLRNSKIHELTIPEAVTSIGEYAIWQIQGFQKLTILATTPPTINTSRNQSPSGNIYVPSSAVDTYRSASGWSSWAAKIVAIE